MGAKSDKGADGKKRVRGAHIDRQTKAVRYEKAVTELRTALATLDYAFTLVDADSDEFLAIDAASELVQEALTVVEEAAP